MEKSVAVFLRAKSNEEDSMVAKASIIKNYEKVDAAGKVDIICKNYSNFIGIVDGYTEGCKPSSYAQLIHCLGSALS